MKKYPFFSRIGAFSINLDDPKAALRSLRYALQSMKRNQASLFIYPEGELIPASDSKPEFKSGLAWLYQNISEKTDFVPIAFYLRSFRGSKPELYINIGSSTSFPKSLPKKELTKELELAIYNLLKETRKAADFPDKGFQKI